MHDPYQNRAAVAIKNLHVMQKATFLIHSTLLKDEKFARLSFSETSRRSSTAQIFYTYTYRIGRGPSLPRISVQFSETDTHSSNNDKMKRLHVIGGKNHGKTTLIVELVQELSRRGLVVGTIKHTHHEHELDVPGKDSHRHRTAGASVVGILSPALHAVFLATGTRHGNEEDRYTRLAPLYAGCQLVLVEGDSAAMAPKIEVWRSELQTPPLAARNDSIRAIVTDDPVSTSTPVLPRSQVRQLANWICENAFAEALTQ
jgi:molybdopterin-guanine dinucleotide biosynthesis protein MobB